MFCKDEFSEIGLNKSLAQINYSHSNKKFTVRGFHFQYPPDCETKIVTCINGEVFDVALDLRAGSPTFLKWFGSILSEKNNRSMFIPEGFAHATQTLTDKSSLMYMHSEAYSPLKEDGVNINDPIISVKWKAKPLNLSKRDASFPYLSSNFQGIIIE